MFHGFMEGENESSVFCSLVTGRSSVSTLEPSILELGLELPSPNRSRAIVVAGGTDVECHSLPLSWLDGFRLWGIEPYDLLEHIGQSCCIECHETILTGSGPHLQCMLV